MVSVGGQRPGLPGVPPLTEDGGRTSGPLLLSGTLLVLDELDSLFILILLYNNRS